MFKDVVGFAGRGLHSTALNYSDYTAFTGTLEYCFIAY